MTQCQIKLCGVWGADYFPGEGTMYTPWEYVSVGIGSNAKEAYEDAVEQAHCSYPDTENLNFPVRPKGITKKFRLTQKEADADLNVYVAVFWGLRKAVT